MVVSDASETLKRVLAEKPKCGAPPTLGSLAGLSPIDGRALFNMVTALSNAQDLKVNICTPYY